MVATHQDDLNIFKLIDSIDSNTLNIKVLLIVVSQECEIAYVPKNPLLSIFFIQQSRMGLSKARNIGLDFLKKNNICSKFIMFPDDDTTFDPYFFHYFNKCLNSEFNYVIPIYCENSDKRLYLGKILNEGQHLSYKNHYMIGSPNQVLSYQRNIDYLYFDEKLGVGAIYGSCEDYDLFLRLLNRNEKFLYTSKVYNYHPQKTLTFKNLGVRQIYNRITSYSLGFIYVVKKYNLYALLPYFFLKPLLACFYYLLRINFKLSYLYFKLFFFRVYNFFNFNKNETI